MEYKLSISIVSYNALDEIIKCLDNLSWVKDLKNVKVYITDNASTQNNVEVIKKDYSWVVLTEEKENKGFSSGHIRNLNIARGNHDFEGLLLIINPDLLIPKEGIESLIDKLESNKSVGIIGPKVVNERGALEYTVKQDLNIWDYALKAIGLRIKERFSGKPLTRFSYVQNISGAFMLISNSVINKELFFDPDYFMYTEDMDLCYSVRKAGYKVAYDPDVVAVHGLSKSSENFENADLWRKKQLYLSMFRYFRKNRPRYEYLLFKAGKIFEMYLRILINLKRGWAKEMLKEIAKINV